MTDLFYSPRLTFARAQHHIKDFNRVVGDFVHRDTWAHVVDKDSQPGKEIHKIEFLRPTPDTLPCILFDAVNNLRAVLDQAGYAAAVAAGSPSLKAVKFPFGPTETDFRNNLAGGCKDLPPEIRALFERQNAYEGGNNALWAINEMANAKKHFALIRARIGNVSAAVSHDAGPPPGMAGEFKKISPAVGWDAEKNEMILIIADADADVRGHFAFTVVIDSIKVLARKDARHALYEMSSIVQGILLATEAECRRLGFKISD